MRNGMSHASSPHIECTFLDRGRRSRCALALLLAAGAMAASARQAGAQTVPPEVEINPTTNGDQEDPSTAMLAPTPVAPVPYASRTAAGGGFVSVWEDGGAIKGFKLGDPLEFVVAEHSTYTYSNARVAALEGGGFVVAWDSSDFVSVVGKFDADCQPVGDLVEIPRTGASVWGTPGGGFGVAWEEIVGVEVIKTQRYDENCQSLGDPKTLEPDEFAGYKDARGAALSPPGSRTPPVAESRVVYTGPGDGVLDSSIYSRGVDSSGTPDLTRAQISSGTGANINAAIAFSASGGGLVVWQRGAFDVAGRLTDSQGVPLGSEFQVSSASYVTYPPAVAASPHGDFLVVWGSNGSAGTDTSFGSIQGRYVSPVGTPLRQQFQLNSYTSQMQRNPDVTASPDGSSFLVVWDSLGSFGGDVGSFSIQATTLPAGILFADGFDDGTTEAWSVEAP